MGKLSLIVIAALCTSVHASGVVYPFRSCYADDTFSTDKPGACVDSSIPDSVNSRAEEINIFRSGEVDSATEIKTPALVIDSVQFANIDKKGRIIDNYGDQIEGRYVKYLAQRISYRAITPDSPVTLDVKFFNPQDKLMRDADSPEGCSYRVSFRTGSSDEDHLQYLGKLKSKFGKGYRMEIYDGPECLLSISVPTRGMITYVPIMRKITSELTDEYRRYLDMSLQRRETLFRDLHMRNYTGPFMDNYIITGWRAVEK